MIVLDVTSLTLGIETVGGVMTKIIGRGTKIPTKTTKKPSPFMFMKAKDPWLRTTTLWVSLTSPESPPPPEARPKSKAPSSSTSTVSSRSMQSTRDRASKRRSSLPMTRADSPRGNRKNDQGGRGKRRGRQGRQGKDRRQKPTRLLYLLSQELSRSPRKTRQEGQ